MKVLIVSGGEISSDDFIKNIISYYTPDCIIAADSGANALHRCGIVPHILSGDFDSIDEDVLIHLKDRCEVNTFQPQKDETDTELALMKACDIGATEVLLIGATGSSLDHSFGNLCLLVKALELHLRCSICTETQQIYLIDSIQQFSDMKDIRVSLFPFGIDARGIVTKGFAYPLHNETLRFGDVRGISNIVKEDNASVQISSGRLIAFVDKPYSGK